MMDFLFKKNLWVLDLITSISFSFILGFLLLRDSVTGKPKWADILCGTLAYFFAFILAIILQRKIAWLPSWAWLGIIGALIRIIFLEIIYFPSSWGSDVLKVMLSNWLFWGITGLISIFVIRFFAFLLSCILYLCNLEKEIISRNNK